MGRKIIILFLLVSLWGCNFFRDPGKDRCDKILSAEKMTQVLTDVYIMEGFLLELQTTRPGVRDSSAYFYQAIFDKHEISYQTFEQALHCYLLHREEIDIIHENILNDLSIKMGELQTEYKPPLAGPEALEEMELFQPDSFIGPPRDTLMPAPEYYQEYTEEGLIRAEEEEEEMPQ